MLMKPFKPPSLVNKIASAQKDVSSNFPDGPDAKRRRIGDENGQPPQFKAVPAISTLPLKPAFRQPLDDVSKPNSQTSNDQSHLTYYSVLWRKPTAKKHKTWDGDGFLRVSDGYAYLQDKETGRDMGRAPCAGPLLPESSLSVAGKDVEVDCLLSHQEYVAARGISAEVKQEKPVVASKSSFKPVAPPKKTLPTVTKLGDDRPSNPGAATSNSSATQSKFKNPLIDLTSQPQAPKEAPTPRHDPSVEGALVMKRPTEAPPNKQIVDVVMDPALSKHLREHQREGVKFLYECVMGMRSYDGTGAILADEMGLGKTLQTIALIWTLLKQNPIYGDPPVIRKAVIVCPVTLINNWKKEFRKWLGLEKIGVFVADNTKTRITDFTHGKTYSVMIIGYEKVRKMAEDLQKGRGVDIIVADEGHRLKTAQNKSGVAMKALPTLKRIILSGTPIQNDLTEFYSMVDFVNPGILGNIKSFTRQFEDPIVRSRQPEATPKEVEKGEERGSELSQTTAPFILRRTAEILSKYLPPRTEYVLLCRPTKAQASVYRQVLLSPVFQSALGSSENHLQLITILKKVCNSPGLLAADPTSDPEKNLLSAELISNLPPHLLKNAASCKVRVLDQFLSALRSTTSEKVVLVSNFTSTLDLLSSLLTSLSMGHLRLDGSTPVGKRQELVDTFNRAPARDCFAFLLSAKAGGLGLNLVGASRLILFDVDWNPATDTQAMARIHRDGQKRPCVVYRLLMAGALDEKIWQRQVTKLGLASSVMDQKAGTSSFSRAELRDLFRLDDGKGCQTHELIGCECGGRGIPDVAVEEGAERSLNGQEPTLDSGGQVHNDGEQASNRVEQSRNGVDQPLKEERSLPGGLIPAGLVKSSEVNVEEQERLLAEQAAARRKRKQGAEMQSLLAYSHIDTSKFATEADEDMEALVHDEVLLSVLKNEDNRVAFAFAKTTGG